MSKKSNEIILNGKRYDARTGKLISEASKTTAKTSRKPANTTPPSPAKQPKVSFSRRSATVDGFSRPNKPAASGKSRPRSQSNTPANSVHTKTERSKTLVRQAVKKPATIKLETTAKRRSAINSPEAKPATKKPKVISKINPLREVRAKKTPKSAHISRFGRANQTVAKKTAVVPVSTPPKPARQATTAKKPTSPVRSSTSAKRPVAQKPSPIETALKQISTPVKATKKSSRKPLSARVAKKLRTNRKVVNITASIFAIAILGGYFTYQSIPNISMQVASSRAGVAGELPRYQPAGFAMRGPIHYEPGQIVLTYRSNSDNREFRLVQKASQWNSDTLLENFVNVDRRAYQTFQEKGKTIFIYDNNATWVSNGIWYQIEGDSSLNSDQLLRIAGSL